MPIASSRRAALAAFASFAFAALPARAEAPPAALVRSLDLPGRRHPLADAGGRVPLTIRLPEGLDAAALGLLEVAPRIGAIRLAPGEVGAFSAAHPDLRLALGPPRRALLDASGAWTHVPQVRKDTGLTGTGVVVGVVDTGLDVRHPDFRNSDGRTRVAWMLVAGMLPRGVHADLEEKFGCTDPKQSPCAVFDAADIDAYLAGNGDDLVDLEGHGTHVTSIAAGNGGPMAGKPKYVGQAPNATLVIAAPSPTGGFYDTDILNGTRFVFDRADAMKLPAVVNLSIGGDYGSHDGLSDLEQGLSAMVGDRKPGRVIVVAAGNSGDVATAPDGSGPYGIHTEAHVVGSEQVRVPISATAATYGEGYVWLTFQPGDDVEVGFEGPGGKTWVGFTGKGDQDSYKDGSGDGAITATVVNDLPKEAPQISASTNSAVIVFTGHWAEGSELAVLLRGKGHAQLWITGEKDAAGGLLFERAMQQGTVGLPASAPALLAVGCTINRLAWTPFDNQPLEIGALGDDNSPVPDGACYFSGTGPTPFGVQKPEISAPGGFVAAAMSKDADPRKVAGGLFDLIGCPSSDKCGVVDDRHGVAAGTSMSAPHVSGAVALLLQMDPTLTQARVTQLLQAGARRVSGHQPDAIQLGPGELDLEGALEALAAGPPAPPDPIHSWTTLSSLYARPDLSWPVWGTAELRSADGKVASGVDGSELSLRVTGGAIVQPLTRVSQFEGLWRFAVAGNPGDVGGKVTVEVSYAGQSIGRQVLPIGQDYWAAMGPPVAAVGGCGCRVGATSGPGGVPAGVVALASLLGLRRRRRAASPVASPE